MPSEACNELAVMNSVPSVHSEHFGDINFEASRKYHSKLTHLNTYVDEDSELSSSKYLLKCANLLGSHRLASNVLFMLEKNISQYSGELFVHFDLDANPALSLFSGISTSIKSRPRG